MKKVLELIHEMSCLNVPHTIKVSNEIAMLLSETFKEASLIYFKRVLY
jgi:hypothetical protein